MKLTKKESEDLGKYCRIPDLILFRSEQMPMDQFVFVIVGFITEKRKRYAILRTEWSPLDIWAVPKKNIIIQKGQ